MSKKFHVSKNGSVGICSAQKGSCPLGGENQHFSSSEEAQKFADKKNELTIEKSELIKQYKTAVKLKDKFKLKRRITEINSELELDSDDGLYTKEEIEKRNALKEAREKELERVKLAQKKAEEDFKNLEYINLSEIADVEVHLFKDGYFKRWRTNCYRGETNSSEKGQGGLAIYGEGRYSTTNKKYASQFGKVREVDTETELPAVALSFKSMSDFDGFEHKVARHFGINRSQLGNPDEYISKMGYDGLTVGDKKDMIVLLFKDEINRKNS